MVFDLSSTNKLPRSSTSSCTDYFYDGCHSTYLNKCEYQNCKCRSCCINSIINDYTYTLLKKVCRKVIRDYQRQRSREIYTIFNGGSSINVRIHRTSIVPTEDGKSKAMEPTQKDSKKSENFAERNGAFLRKKINGADALDNDAGSKRIEGIQNRRKNHLYELERDSRKKGRGTEDATEKQRKAKANNANADGGGKDEHDGGPKTQGVVHVAEADVQGDFSRHKIRKAKQMEYANKDKSGDIEGNKKAVIRKRGNYARTEEIHPIDAGGKTGKEGQDKDKQRILLENGNGEHSERTFYKSKKNKREYEEFTGTSFKFERYKKSIHEARKRERSSKDYSGFRDARLEEPDNASNPKLDHNTKSHVEGRSSPLKDRRVISDLRAKVRRRHDVIALQSHRKRKYGSRISNERRKRSIPSIQRQLSKTTKDRSNEGHGSRSRFRASRRIGIKFVRYREYRNSILSRSDEVRPCDILRAHMEQRELCEGQRYYRLLCSCNCSAVYCQAPSTTCCPLY